MNSDSNYFSNTAEQFNNNYNSKPYFKERIKIFEKYINENSTNFNNSSLCMDLGCGSGIMSILLAKKGFRVVAVDGSEEMLSIARENSEKEQCDHLINYQFQNLSDFTGFVKKHKDLTSIAICSSVVEYLENPEKI